MTLTGLILLVALIVGIIWLASAVVGGANAVLPGGTLTAIVVILFIWWLLTRT